MGRIPANRRPANIANESVEYIRQRIFPFDRLIGDCHEFGIDYVGKQLVDVGKEFPTGSREIVKEGLVNEQQVKELVVTDNWWALELELGFECPESGPDLIGKRCFRDVILAVTLFRVAGRISLRPAGTHRRLRKTCNPLRR